MNLNKKVALVTSATRGIGFASALKLAENGATVYMGVRRLEATQEIIDKYPNLKNYLSEKEWDKVRSEDGHIYIIPQFGVIQGEDTATNFNDEAFWIQKAVLEWDNYPEIKTLDQYFDLIERYKEANPTINGNPTIGFEILTHDWRYFCLENPPQFIAGYPNDGSAIVDPETLEAKIMILFQKLRNIIRN